MNSIIPDRSSFSSNLPYLLKCLIGVVCCYILYEQIPQYPFYWSLVSVVLALSPDNSNRQAYDRMKANVLGCGVGLCLYPLDLPNLVLLCLGVVLTIYVGIYLRLTNTLRAALAALVIVTIHEQQDHQWYIALERVFCVVVGCIVALVITIIFNMVFKKMKWKRHH